MLILLTSMVSLVVENMSATRSGNSKDKTKKEKKKETNEKTPVTHT